MKLFLDANVLFTAAYSEQGISRALFHLAAARKCALITSPFSFEEAKKNLELKAPDKGGALVSLKRYLSIVPEAAPDKIAWAVLLPLSLKDAPIMAVAVQCGADVLVTGDRRDFGHLFGMTLKGVQVLAPVEALKLVVTYSRTG
jgi:predicted nucleic acid-binding protein